MRRLNKDEVKRLAEMMEMSLERVRAFAEILFSEKEKGNFSFSIDIGGGGAIVRRTI